jgi:hypothetical protein
MGTTSSFQRIARKKWVGDFPDNEGNYPLNASHCQERKQRGAHGLIDPATAFKAATGSIG